MAWKALQITAALVVVFLLVTVAIELWEGFR